MSKIKKGDVYGIYTVLGLEKDMIKDGHKCYKVKCNKCGAIRYLASNSFAVPSSIIQRCIHPEKFGVKKWNIKDKRLRNIFQGMCYRCYDKNYKDYRFYGAKNVYIYKPWLKDPSKFEKWAKKHGYKKNLTIDRKDPKGPYSPKNCRWITMRDNAKYKSTTHIYTIDGEIDTGRGWAENLGLGTNRINICRRKYGREFTEHYLWNTKNGFQTLMPKENMKGILF